MQVDERAVLKHFDWPEMKADCLREAAYEYHTLSKLHADVAACMDDPDLTVEENLKDMLAILER